MQSLAWYVNRLRTMSPGEIFWRIKSLAAAIAEHSRVSMNLIAQPQYKEGVDLGGEFKPPFRVSDTSVGCWKENQAYQPWHDALLKEASLIKDHKLSFFNLKDHFLGDPINWNYDHGSQITAPLKPILQVDYRDCPNFGDCKLVWEPNRHHHLVVLARAYRATGDVTFAQEVVDQIESWLDQNPYGKGMNWRSPLELGIRLINWVWAIDLILESGLFTGKFKERLLNSVFLHCRDVAGKYSQGSSANNHLVGEAAGVYVAAAYFNVFKQSESWAEEAKAIVIREIEAQSFADGCTREHALGYQFFVFQFYLICGLFGKLEKQDFPNSYWQRLESIVVFLAELSEAGRSLPMFGDRDDGYVLSLGNKADDMVGVLDVARHVFKNPYLEKLAAEQSETGFWLFGEGEPSEANGGSAAISLQSKAYKDSGYYLLQHGQSLDNSVSLLVDVAELGYTAIAAHGHADALAFTMRVNGQDLLVDSGTFDYFTYPKWRNYFRTTKAHNTVEVDGEDQSLMTGPFMWEKHAKSECLEWAPGEEQSILRAQHDGYTRLENPVMHRRDFTLNGQVNELVLSDTFECSGQHQLKWHFHFSEFCEVTIDGGCCVVVMENGSKVNFSFDDALQLSLVKGDASNNDGNIEPTLGWLSRGYHQKVAVFTLVVAGSVNGNTSFDCKISWS